MSAPDQHEEPERASLVPGGGFPFTPLSWLNPRDLKPMKPKPMTPKRKLSQQLTEPASEHEYQEYLQWLGTECTIAKSRRRLEEHDKYIQDIEDATVGVRVRLEKCRIGAEAWRDFDVDVSTQACKDAIAKSDALLAACSLRTQWGISESPGLSPSGSLNTSLSDSFVSSCMAWIYDTDSDADSVSALQAQADDGADLFGHLQYPLR